MLRWCSVRSSGIGQKLFLAFFIVITLGFGTWLNLSINKPGPLMQPADVVIPPHTKLLQTGADLKAASVINNEYLFAALAWATGNKNKIKAGEYEFPADVTMWQVVSKMGRGEIVVRKVTFIEGWTVKQIVAELKNNPFLTGDITTPPAEGTLMPDTYTFTRGDTRASVIARMQKEMEDFVARHWAQRDPNYALKTPEEWLKLASIVEAETPKKDERARVAGVYLNRLAKPMRLEADPTVIYGLNGGAGPLGRALTLDDLKNPHAYNTYMHDGLPPTPINNPGKASLLAALSPEKHNYYFFVADGTGGHTFATTFEEHKQNRERLK